MRIPVLYGDEEYMGESAVSALIKNLQNEEPVKVSNYEVRFPSHTEDIATICFNLVERRLKVSRNNRNKSTHCFFYMNYQQLKRITKLFSHLIHFLKVMHMFVFIKQVESKIFIK